MKLNLSITVILFLGLLTNELKAQFNVTPATTPLFQFGRTDFVIQGVGIGFFPATIETDARLHISNFYCSSPAGLLNGLLLRTDGSGTIDNRWTIFTGATAGTTTEKFKLFVPSLTNDAILQTTQNGRLFLASNALKRVNVGHLAFCTSLIGIGLLFPNPVAGNRLTRTMINRDGNWPITKPLALLHLGEDFDVKNIGLGQGGQRNWMDVGVICMLGTHHINVI